MPESINSSILEKRRLRAVQLSEKGWSVTRIAKALNVSVPAVSIWLSTQRKSGIEGLRSKPRTGAHRRLSDRHGLMLEVLLKSKPKANNIDAPQWDRSLVQSVIERLFGTTYSLQHCGRLLRSAQASSRVFPRVVKIELSDLLKKADIARIRTQMDSRNGRDTK